MLFIYNNICWEFPQDISTRIYSPLVLDIIRVDFGVELANVYITSIRTKLNWLVRYIAFIETIIN